MNQVLERWDRSPQLAQHGVSFLLYGLLDVVIDTYFDSIEVFDDYYDAISETIFGDHPINPEQQLHWFQMRRALFQLHRLAVPMRETVSALMRREHGAVAEDMYPYFQDVYDHILRVTESTDALRDLVATIVETNLSLRDYRQNQVMKKVTSWAAIIAVPTLITGYYGMNVKYPGLGSVWAAWMSAAADGGPVAAPVPAVQEAGLALAAGWPTAPGTAPAEVLDLVAEAGGVLEAQLLRRLGHLRLERPDQPLQLVAGQLGQLEPALAVGLGLAPALLGRQRGPGRRAAGTRGCR